MFNRFCQKLSGGLINLATQVFGNLDVSHLNGGSGADSTSYWRGDGTWAVPGGTGEGAKTTENIIQNSRFQVRNKTGQASVIFDTGTAKQHVRRWYGLAGDTGFRTEIDSANTAECLKVKRYSGDATDDWRLVQVFDTEDSLRIADKAFTFCVIAKLKNSSTNAADLRLSVHTGTGTDQSLANFLGGSWTGQTEELSFNNTLTDTYQEFFMDGTISAGAKQIALQLSSSFPLTNSADDEIWIKQITATESPGHPSMDSKSLALVRAECDRYFQEMDPYLTTTKISIPINMRAVPTVTAGVACTTTGTTADVLVINRNSGSGSVNVQLSCEL